MLSGIAAAREGGGNYEELSRLVAGIATVPLFLDSSIRPIFKLFAPVARMIYTINMFMKISLANIEFTNNISLRRYSCIFMHIKHCLLLETFIQRVSFNVERNIVLVDYKIAMNS